MDQKEKRSNLKTNLKILLFLLIVTGLFFGSAAITAGITRHKIESEAAEAQKAEQEKAEKAEQEALEALKSDTRLDKYSMQGYCRDNARAVFDALKNNDKQALEDLLINSDGLDSVIDFADWTDADFDEAVSMGSGSLSGEPDDEGRMDESERFFVYAGDTRYVFFIETQTSYYGRMNDGVSAIGVTAFAHFDATDYAWNGEKDDQSALAGELFWKK